jgi:hypothetical protein
MQGLIYFLEDNVMKSLLKKMGFLPVLAILLVGCGSSSRPSITTPVSGSSSGLALDTAIELAAARIEEAFNAGTEIALISVASPSAQFSEYVLTYLESILVNNGKLAIVDRANLDKVRAEQGFQLSGEVSDESAKAIGQMLGAGAIVTGTLVNLGDAYRLTLKAINVETARVTASYPADIANSPRVQTLLASGGGAARPQTVNTGGNTTAPAVPVQPAAQTPAVPAAPPAPVYKVGDTGPAGGIVFYDKGVVTNGWRYLEAAPQDIGPTQWGETEVRGTSTAVGTGKRNTELIIAANRNSGVDNAAQLCAVYDANGYKDWFLPSKDELALIYTNLKARGEFSSGWYWSSSDYSGNNAWAQMFSDGSQTYLGNYSGRKNNTYSVRAVRAF